MISSVSDARLSQSMGSSNLPSTQKRMLTKVEVKFPNVPCFLRCMCTCIQRLNEILRVTYLGPFLAHNTCEINLGYYSGSGASIIVLHSTEPNNLGT